MATIDVVLHVEMGLRVPSAANVPVVAGNSVKFSAGDGAASALFFSPATVSILSPKPESRVDLAAGASVTYTFTSAGSDSYGVVVQAPENPPPPSFDFGASSSLAIQPGGGGDFPVLGGGGPAPGGGGAPLA